MALPWVRMDTQWPHNPKFLMLAEDKQWRAIVSYWAGMGYAGAHGTAGYLPAVALAMTHATKREAAQLADVGLWVPSPGGWEINGYREFQPSDEDAVSRSDRARKAAQKRWADEAKRKAGDLHAV